MSYSEETHAPAGGSPIKTLFAVIGGLATVGAIGIGGASILSADARDCSGRGHPAIVCAAGAVGLVDIPTLLERDGKLERLTAQAAIREGEAEVLRSRLTEAEGRAKELDAAQSAAKAATAEVERLRGEVARRDAKIAELSDKPVAGKRPETSPIPVARPTHLGAPPAPLRPPKP